MTTPMRLHFGIKTAQQHTTYEEMLHIWREADALPIFEHAWLFEHFFEVVRKMGCTEARAITSPVNTGSIGFHTRMGFAILPGDAQIDGVAVTTNYDGRGNDRVLFRRDL